MDDKDKIYELFRRNEHKLSERPPSRAWERMEGRLDGHFRQRRRRVARMRLGGMAAAVLALVVVASVLMIEVGQTADNAAVPQFATTDVETSLMDMPAKGNNGKYLRIVQYQKEYHRDFAKQIVESEVDAKPALKSKGEPQRRIAPLDSDPYDSAIASNDLPANRGSDAKDNRGGGVSSWMDKIWNNDDKTAASEPIAQADFEGGDNAPAEAEFVEEAEPIAMEEEITAAKPVPEMSSAKAEKKKDAPTAATAPGRAAGGKMPAAPSMAEIVEVEEKPMYDMDDQAADFTDVLSEKESLYSTQLFDWLVGTWQQNIDGKESKEVWKRKNANTLLGKGYLKVNGRTVFSERMEIHKSQGRVFMTIKLDDDKGRISYQLTEHAGRKAVFENGNIDFPRQLVLYQNSNNEFTITLKNGAEQLGPDQRDYIQNRNQITPQKIERNLRRVSTGH